MSVRRVPPTCAWSAAWLLALACTPGDPATPPPAEERLLATPRPDFEGLDAKAIEVIQTSIDQLERDIELPALWTQLGMVWHAHRRFELARTCYEQRLLRDPDDARTWYYLALVEDQFGAAEEAVNHLLESREREPNHVPIHWRLGFLRLSLGDIENAAADFETALQVAPQDAATVVGLARVRLQQGRATEAVELLEGHLERLSTDENARFLLGTAYRSVGRMDDAERVLAATTGGEPVRHDRWESEVFALRQGFRTEFLQAVEWLDNGQVERATRRLEELYDQRSEDTLVLINLHRAYRLQGQLDRAIGLLVEALQIAPLEDRIHLHLAGAYRERAHLSGGSPDPAMLGLALASAKKACELSPTYADAQGMQGDLLFDLGRTQDAVALYLLAANLDRTSLRWNERASHELCRLQQWEAALPVVQQLDRLRPDDPGTLLLLGAALANTGDLEAASVTLRRAQQIAPENTDVSSALADLERARAGQPR